MIKPENREITLPDGTKKTYTISKFDAISGREIITQYPISGIPKLGEYKTNEALMLKIMCFVSVRAGERDLLLNSRELVNNHVTDWETLMKLEKEMIEYNCSFFGNGKASSFLTGLTAKLPALITSILTDSLQQFSQKNKPPSKS